MSAGGADGANETALYSRTERSYAMSRILVVDDKELMRDSVATMLTREGWSVQSASNGETALRMISERKPEVVLTDLQMPEMTGVELLREIRRFDEQLPVVFMTAFGSVETAVEAMKLGAYDYITKPFNGDQLIATIRRALQHGGLVRENAILQSQVAGVSMTPSVSSGGTCGSGEVGEADGLTVKLIGSSPPMRTLKGQIKRIAASQSTVLICGESGVGKEVVAQALHELSPRADAPMLAVNCAALSASLLESELFGHERGAFTGADRLRKGRFELADGGTLLLDEISEVPTHIQAKLLRVLQERTFERVGSSISQRADVRVIATTNRDLASEVSNGRFRQDLFYRLNVLPISVPALRNRLEDIGDLAAHFLTMVAKLEGRKAKRFDDEAIELMQMYRWPGNVRELGNICERANLFSEDDVIAARVIRPWLVGGETLGVGVGAVSAARRPASMVEVSMPGFGLGGGEEELVSPLPVGGMASEYVDVANGSGLTGLGALGDDGGGTGLATAIVAVRPGKTLEEIEREVIVATLRRHDGHRQRTAQDLGIAVRTLGLKLRKWKDLQLVDEDL